MRLAPNCQSSLCKHRLWDWQQSRRNYSTELDNKHGCDNRVPQQVPCHGALDIFPPQRRTQPAPDIHSKKREFQRSGTGSPGRCLADGNGQEGSRRGQAGQAKEQLLRRGICLPRANDVKGPCGTGIAHYCRGQDECYCTYTTPKSRAFSPICACRCILFVFLCPMVPRLLLTGRRSVDKR